MRGFFVFRDKLTAGNCLVALERVIHRTLELCNLNLQFVLYFHLCDHHEPRSLQHNLQSSPVDSRFQFSRSSAFVPVIAESVSLFPSQVRHMWYDGTLQEVMASDTWRKYISSFGFHNLARVASLCNRAAFKPLPRGSHRPPLHRRKILGDASDAALLKCMEVLVRGGVHAYRRRYKKVLTIVWTRLIIFFRHGERTTN